MKDNDSQLLWESYICEENNFLKRYQADSSVPEETQEWLASMNYVQWDPQYGVFAMPDFEAKAVAVFDALAAAMKGIKEIAPEQIPGNRARPVPHEGE